MDYRLSDYEVIKFATDCYYARMSGKAACIEHRILWPENKMTPQEQLFAKFFNEEAGQVKDLDDLALDAHIEQLRLFALEANARISASVDEKKTRTPKGKIRSFIAPNEVDPIATDAINAIKTRAARMSKRDKLIKSIMSTGVSEAEARELTSAHAISEQIKKPKVAKAITIRQQPIPSSTGVRAVDPFAAKRAQTNNQTN